MPIFHTISILGCGWLGLPLALELCRAGYTVKGSTTSESKLSLLKEKGIEPYWLVLNPEIEGENYASFFQTDVLILSFPPRLRINDEHFYLKQLSSLLAIAADFPIKNLVFISSTSVYDELNREVSENDASPENVLTKAEWMVKKVYGDKLTILRMSGLMGYERIPAKYFAGKKGLTTGNIRVNYIHQDDAVGIMKAIVEQQIWGEVINVSAPEHPTRKAIYLKNCEEFGYEPPEFVEPTLPHDFKVISTQKLQKLVRYTFKYPNPLDFHYERPT